jgi:hypothetical protein
MSSLSPLSEQACCRELELFQLRDTIEAFIPNFASTNFSRQPLASLITMLRVYKSPRPALIYQELSASNLKAVAETPFVGG